MAGHDGIEGSIYKIASKGIFIFRRLDIDAVFWIYIGETFDNDLIEFDLQSTFKQNNDDVWRREVTSIKERVLGQFVDVFLQFTNDFGIGSEFPCNSTLCSGIYSK